VFNDPQFAQTIWYAVAMAGGYIVGKVLKLSTEICLFFSVIAGGLVAGAGFDIFRHMAEGSVTYLDIGLIFIFATLFMNILKESGAMNMIVRWIIRVFGDKKILLLILLMVVLLIPGALTGAGSISVLVVGGTVSAALTAMDLKKERVAAIIFIVAGLSAAAPPINVWAMMTCAGTAVPYVGFTWPLLVPVLILGLFTVLFLGWKGKVVNKETALKAIPEPKGLNVWSVAVPFIVLVVLLALPRILPFDFPVLGLPLSFAICALVAWLMNRKRIKVLKVFSDTIVQLTPLLATTVVVGMFVQIMSFNGTKGLFSLWIVTAPMALLYILLPFIIPISEGLLTYGGIAVLGVPLIWMFNARGINTVIALAGLTLLWPLGDGLPPTKLIGRLTVDTVGYTGSYGRFLKECLVPWIAITIVGVLMVAFSNQLAFLMG
jgi:CitMHS family citrate-Mg2+:H+ or citrate-Ca2+:H+ symporter